MHSLLINSEGSPYSSIDQMWPWGMGLLLPPRLTGCSREGIFQALFGVWILWDLKILKSSSLSSQDDIIWQIFSHSSRLPTQWATSGYWSLLFKPSDKHPPTCLPILTLLGLCRPWPSLRCQPCFEFMDTHHSCPAYFKIPALSWSGSPRKVGSTSATPHRWKDSYLHHHG